MMGAFVDATRGAYGIEPIGAVLPIAPSSRELSFAKTLSGGQSD
jgi:hypothetical protein